jgi:hypothetical protein
VKRQSKHGSEPEEFIILRSEIEAASAPRISKGYWDSSVRHLLLLRPDQVLMLVFRSNQAPRGVRSSIHAAAARAGVRVSVKVSGAVVYLWKVGTRVSTATPSSRPAIKCEVCGKLIPPVPGTSKQFVCGGVEARKSRCQKIRRSARERGISIDEAKARWPS